MVSIRLHAVLSIVANWYLLAVVVGAVAALAVLASDATPPLWSSLVISLLTLLVPVAYQIRSARAPFLSPGEILAGRVFDGEGNKTWVNPWYANRWALYVVLLPAMTMSGNTWDSIWEGNVYSMGEILGKILVLSILWIGFLATGRGSLAGPLIVTLYHAVLGAGLFLNPQAPSEEAAVAMRAFGVAWVGFAFLSLVITITYNVLRERRAPGTDPIQGPKTPPTLPSAPAG